LYTVGATALSFATF